MLGCNHTHMSIYIFLDPEGGSPDATVVVVVVVVVVIVVAVISSLKNP